MNSEALIEQAVSVVETSIAFLEAGDLVLNVASGVRRVDTSALKLKKILETVQRIEGKIDTMLETPLNVSRDFIESAYIAISNKNFDTAFKLLEDVIREATKAYYLQQKEKIVTVENFVGCMQAIKFLVLANVLVFSYDDKKKKFRPFHQLPKKKKNNIGDELERLVKKSLDLKNKVNTKGRLFRSDSKAAKVKDTFDSVLQVTYPYISEAKGWSSAKTKVSSRSSKMHIQVMPKFVPFGFEDATEVKTGVKVNKGRLKKSDFYRFGV